MPEERAVLAVLRNGQLMRLAPKPLAAQVEAITKRKHYKEAIGVAEDQLARLQVRLRKQKHQHHLLSMGRQDTLS